MACYLITEHADITRDRKYNKEVVFTLDHQRTSPRPRTDTRKGVWQLELSNYGWILERCILEHPSDHLPIVTLLPSNFQTASLGGEIMIMINMSDPAEVMETGRLNFISFVLSV